MLKALLQKVVRLLAKISKDQWIMIVNFVIQAERELQGQSGLQKKQWVSDKLKSFITDSVKLNWLLETAVFITKK